MVADLSLSTSCSLLVRVEGLAGRCVAEIDRLDFAKAYLVATTESPGVDAVASFDKSIDRVTTIERIEPPRKPK